MHQPFYKDLVDGEYKLPWTRMHALKDYYGMVKVLEDFPSVHQTFNLVPSMLIQIEEYASGKAADPFLRLALKPAENLTTSEKEFILQYFFQANETHLIGRYPRYAELFRLMQKVSHNPQRALPLFSADMFRDLQILSQLAWFDEEYQTHDEDIRRLVAKGRDFSLEDQALLGKKQIEVLQNVLRVYQDFSKRGQIELSATPFYHPILPLLCDSNIASVSHPYVPLPSRFSYPNDAKEHLVRSKAYFAEKFGAAPAGLWPSEGSVSDEVFRIAAEQGFQWIGTDNGVLARTLHQPANPSLSYQPFLWKQAGKQIHVLFRDHHLSDLIGFVYSRMNARAAAEHFLREIKTNCGPILAQGRDALVPIILDGENAWEYYTESGRPFLRTLYSLIANDASISAVTVSEALGRVPSYDLTNIFPGSWINANFDVWIGAEEDNRAWEYLLQARQTYDQVMQSPDAAKIDPKSKELAWEELLIAEGSDWCWWYGPEHASANRPEFDQLYRDHLANVYRLLGQPVPSELSRPILTSVSPGFHEAPTGLISPVIDGELVSYFEWMGAGLYRLDLRSGAMHSQRSIIHELRYGSDGKNIFLRFDFAQPLSGVGSFELRLNFRSPSNTRSEVLLYCAPGQVEIEKSDLADGSVDAALGKIFEARISMSALQVKRGGSVFAQLSVFQDGLPMDALPVEGELEIFTSEPSSWAL